MERDADAEDDEDGTGGSGKFSAVPTLGRSLLQATIHEEDDDSEDDEDDPAGHSGGGGGGDGDGRRNNAFGHADNANANDDNDYYEDIEISPEDERAMAAFMAPKDDKERTLADIILEKIKAKEAAAGGGRGLKSSTFQLNLSRF